MKTIEEENEVLLDLQNTLRESEDSIIDCNGYSDGFKFLYSTLVMQLVAVIDMYVKSAKDEN